MKEFRVTLNLDPRDAKAHEPCETPYDAKRFMKSRFFLWALLLSEWLQKSFRISTRCPEGLHESASCVPD